MPKETIQLLNELERLGMTDDDFRIIHHQKETATIERHRQYCRDVGSFRANDTNESVRHRLIWIQRAIRKGDYPRPIPRDDFRALAEEAAFEIPR